MAVHSNKRQLPDKLFGIPIDSDTVFTIDGVEYRIQSYVPDTGLVRTDKGDMGESEFRHLIEEAPIVEITTED